MRTWFFCLRTLCFRKRCRTSRRSLLRFISTPAGRRRRRLFRHPLRDVKEVELPSFQASLRRPNRLEDLGSRGRRSFLHAQLDMQGFAIHVISIRFIAGRPPSTRPGSARVGTLPREDAPRGGRFFLDYLSRLKGPVVFGGDLNAPPSSRLIRRLSEVAQDAWQRIGGGDPPSK